MNRVSKLLLCSVMSTAFLVACGGGDDDDLDDRLDLADPKVRLVHAVPLAPEVSLFRDDVAQASEVTNVPYKGASRYFDVESNSARWEVRLAESPEAVVGGVEFEAERGQKYTLIAVPSSGSLTEVVNVRDPFDRALGTNDARLRVFHAAANAGNVDVYLTQPAADLTTATAAFSDVEYKEAAPASGENSIETEGGTYRLRLTAAGTRDVVFNAQVQLDENADWLIVVVPDSIEPNAVRVLVVKSDDGAPAIELVSED
jgi:hypothetical protein